MKLYRLLLPATIATISLTTRIYAQNQKIADYKPLAPFNSQSPEEPRKQTSSKINLEAILPPKDEILEEIEIKNNR